MSRQTFPDATVWANEATEMATPDTSRWRVGYLSGAGQQPPAAGVHNYEFNRLDQQAQHVERNGVPRWDARTPYEMGGWTLAADHMLYRSKINGNAGNNPITDNGTNWRSLSSIASEKQCPVGSVMFRPKNPGLTEAEGGLGFGSWTLISGRSLIGAGQYTDGNGETREFGAGNTYGEYSHKLTSAEMPRHSHSMATGVQGTKGASTYEPTPAFSDGWGYGAIDYTPPTPSSPTGGDQPHNNLQPSFAVAIWYRTA